MAEPKGKRDFRDRARINVKERHELAYWAKRWGVSTDQIVSACRKVGQDVKDIAAELGKRR